MRNLISLIAGLNLVVWIVRGKDPLCLLVVCFAEPSRVSVDLNSLQIWTMFDSSATHTLRL